MKSIAPMIDHTILKPEATSDSIRKLCQEALEYGFASVCVNPCYVPLCSSLLKGSPVNVCTVIGFPLGANATQTKAFEAKLAVENGADEVDMVINVGAAKTGDGEYLKSDIAAVVKAASGKLVKVIIETCLLTDEERVLACTAAKEAGADFVKTSTGFSSGGATAEDISLMRRAVGELIGVKASGGVRDYETAKKMIEAGATRIGTSSSIKIIQEEKKWVEADEIS